MKYVFLALGIILLWSACSKTPTINYSRESMLRNGKWHVTDGTLTVRKPNGQDTVLKYTDWIPFCHKDDYIVFDSFNRGHLFPSTVRCDPSEDSTAFLWKLENGETTMSLYNGFTNTFAITESIIIPFELDTITKTPYLVVDTIVNAATAAAMTPPGVIVLDTIWKLHFDTTAVPSFNIYTAVITNFSESSFTINYAMISQYPDSTNHQTGYDATHNIDFNPVWRPDTFHYSVTYSKL